MTTVTGFIHPDALYSTRAAADVIPGTTAAGLAKMRERGIGPEYVQHRPRGAVTYRGSDLIAWIESAVRKPGGW